MVSRHDGLLLFWIVSSSLLCFCLTTASICVHGKQYLNTKLELCVNCTECGEGDAVLFPCEIHRDTVCGPVSEVLKFVQPNNHHRHKHFQRHRNQNGDSGSTSHKGGENDEVIRRYGDEMGGEPLASSPVEVTSTEAPFSSAETLVWDWQAIALTSAVFACILFFLAITLYSLHQAKQWRRLKDNFDADVEELSARLSLMAAVTSSCSASEKGDILESSSRMGGGGGPGGPINDGNYLNNRCLYLEQLLNVRKDTKIGTENGGGNVYIEESSSCATTTTNLTQGANGKM